MVAFRSLLIPATAAVMNLLAAAASFGVLTAFFQWGWGTGAFGLGAAGPVEAFLPVFMLAILFGLSMDYQVFLVSRMHEEWARSRDNRRAVRAGQAGTARVITAAAAIMICVFVAFSLIGQRRGRRVRHRPGGRGRARRVHPAYGAGAGRDAPVRQGQLVAARLAGPAAAAPGHRAPARSSRPLRPDGPANPDPMTLMAL